MKAQIGCSGLRICPGYLGDEARAALFCILHGIFALAPLFTPRMPRSGQPLRVRTANCGPLGWVSDEAGYRYQALYPETGTPWQPIPSALLATRRACSRREDGSI